MASVAIHACPTCRHRTVTVTIQRTFPPAVYLDSPIPPSKSTRKKLQREVSRANQDVDLVDLEVQRLERELSQLKRQREQLCSIRDRYRKVLSGNLVVPTEVLMTIFEFCILDQPTHLSGNPYNRFVSWTLSTVCRRWRDIALSMPQLWNKFKIDFPESTSFGLTEMIHMYLTRSDRSPLFLHFGRPKSIGRIRKSTIQTIAEHSDHWQEASFSDAYLAYLIQSNRSFPLLQGLNLYYATRIYDFSGYPFNTAINLTTLQLSGKIEPRGVTSILLSSPSIERLYLDMQIRSPYDSGLSVRLTLPRLRILHLSGTLSFNTFIRHVETPELEVLRILDCSSDLRQSVSLLEKAPKLCQLCIGTYGDSLSFIAWSHALDLGMHPNLGRCLRQVALLCFLLTGEGVQPDINPLMAMIHSRLGHPDSHSCLQSLTVSSELYTLLFDWIPDLQAVGFDLQERDYYSYPQIYDFDKYFVSCA